jgi:O-methyltransferase
LSFLFYFNPKDIGKVLEFLIKPRPKASFFQRLHIIKRLYAISRAVDCRHTENEIISFMEVILSLPDTSPGCVVEAGCFKGGSTAKFSIAARQANRKLVVFDSFEGLPEHDEILDKRSPGWRPHPPGSFSATLNEVKDNINRYGEPESCEFIPGWFEDTMPDFSRPVSAVFLDVALASSTCTCLKYLYPLLITGGTLYSNDGYSPLICNVFGDDKFWQKEVGYTKPHIASLGRQKVIKIVKTIDLKDRRAY